MTTLENPSSGRTPPSARSAERVVGDPLRPIRIWLYGLAAFVIVILVVGGITRLTESGLSITTWRPVSGTIPPLNEAEWLAEFAAYQQIPQFEAVHSWMSLDDFKFIFFWEWLHRVLGRVLGLLFIVPFIVFLVRRQLPRSLAWPLFGLFLLGGFQGFLGWWMVTSGLSDLISVSQYRLATHLCAAALLFMALIYVPRRITPGAAGGGVARGDRGWAMALMALIFLQIGAGGFVAGLDAGSGYNTWPLMDGQLIPNGLFVMQPAWSNLFENALTVQFIHRMLAYAIVLHVGFMLWRKWRRGALDGVHAWLPRLAMLVLIQVALGVWTLLAAVPISLAVGHQTLAFMLGGAVIAYLADMQRSQAVVGR